MKALETFIQTQRTLLTRQKSDIERLRQLRIDLAQKPTQVLSNLSKEVCCLLFFIQFSSSDFFVSYLAR